MAEHKEPAIRETGQHAVDADWHRRTYVAIMKKTGELILPIVLGVTVLTVFLLLGKGVVISGVAALVTALGIRWVVRSFFSH